MSQQDFLHQGQGDPVLLLHSSMSSKSQWKALIADLSQTHQVIALDLMGYGAAGYPIDDAGYSLAAEGTRIDQLLANLGIAVDQPIQVVGHSFGGAVALRWCHTHPYRVKALHIFEPVAFHLLDGAGDGFEQISGVVARLQNYIERGEVRAACETFIDYWSGAGAFASFPPHIQEGMTQQINKVLLDFTALLQEECRIADFARFTFPVTLLKGKFSPIASREIAILLSEKLDRVECHEFDCGHMGPITHADLINSILLKAVAAH